MTNQNPRECAHRRCEKSATQKVRYPSGDKQSYCDRHTRALSDHSVRYRVVSVA